MHCNYQVIANCWIANLSQDISEYIALVKIKNISSPGSVREKLILLIIIIIANFYFSSMIDFSIPKIIIWSF